MWNGRRVLVTGAGGFIGSHLCEHLVARGAQVRAFLRYTSSASRGWLEHSDAAHALDYHYGDVADRDSVQGAVDGMDIVFHLAALIGIPYSYAAPESYVRTNITGTLNVLRACRSAGVDRLLHTSTSEVYGTAQYVPIDEQHPLVGQSPYSASKIGADQIVVSFQRSFELPAVIVRPFNTYGPRQSQRAVIPTIIAQCLAGGAIRLGQTHTTRDFNYVEDTVRGFIAAAESDNAVGRTVNLGTGREISIRDLALLIAEKTGASARIEHESERDRPRDSEVERLLADAQLARKLTGWEPEVSLEDGLDRTIEWFSKASLAEAARYHV